MKINKTISKDKSILVLDNVLPLSTLGSLFNTGEKLRKKGMFKQHYTHHIVTKETLTDTAKRNALSFNLKQVKEERTIKVKVVEQLFRKSLSIYLDQYNVLQGVDNPKSLLLERQNINTFFPSLNYLFYRNNEGHYNTWHTDIDYMGQNPKYSKHQKTIIYHPKLFSFILYLTSNKDTYTEFAYFDTKVPAKAGRLLIFPCHWPYLHKAGLAKNGDKLVLASHLHYDNSATVAAIFNDYDYQGKYPAFNGDNK
tara:strand:- start:4594 stop:5352 length:759 start_codon:yes stop_codon:yes gene_type:complete